MNRWKVDKPEEGSRREELTWRAVDLANAGFEHWFHTWREAMDYADQAARTVEVVLPRGAKAEHPNCWFHVFYKTGWICATNGFGSIEVSPNDAKPLALALLAHHYQTQRKE